MFEQLRINKFIQKAKSFSPFEIGKYDKLYDLIRQSGKPVTPQKMGLKLIFISDTHGYLAFDSRLPHFMDSVGDYDLCILLGDIHPAEMPHIIDCIPTERIIALKGNHDSFSLYSDYGICEISEKVFKYKGVRFAGIDGSFRYKNEDFPSHTQYESLVIAKRLPDADILLTHDVMLDDFTQDPAHSGLIGISHYVYRHAVQWHFHGHIHKSYQSKYSNGTVEKSIYLCEYVEV